MLAKILGAYYNYTRGKRKEDDVAVRRKLMAEMEKSRTNLQNVMESLYEKKEKTSTNSVKRCIDEIDMFRNEVDLSEMGHSYPFFSIQNTADENSVTKLVEYDKSLVLGLENVTKATMMLNNALLDGQQLDSASELKKVQQYISNYRNEYKDRKDYIRGLA